MLPQAKLGAVPGEPLTADEHARNNLPDVLARWAELAGEGAEFQRLLADAEAEVDRLSEENRELRERLDGLA